MACANNQKLKRVFQCGKGKPVYEDFMTGDADAARWDALEAQWMREEKQAEDIHRAGELLCKASIELCENGRSRRFFSLLLRAHDLAELQRHL